MKHIKKFETLNSANGFVIPKPFVGCISDGGQVINCNEEDKKIIIENGQITIIDSGPKMIDLGLPSGLKWAKYNLGAKTETEYGNYYQWAGITELNVSGTTISPAADWALCPYTDSASNPSKYTGSDYNILQPADDAVKVQYNDYRMPTKEEFEELINPLYTDSELIYINSIRGYKFMKKSDHSIYVFFPICGYCTGSSLRYVNAYGGYWSSTHYGKSIPQDSWCLYMTYSGGFDMYNDWRYKGYSIRPVC